MSIEEQKAAQAVVSWEAARSAIHDAYQAGVAGTGYSGVVLDLHFRACQSPPSYTHEDVMRLVEAQKELMHWAQTKCPCHEETPNPCTLCGATVEAGACKAVEETFPRHLLQTMREALAPFTHQAKDGSR